ncbi:hypothetical protein B0T17DRAFT_557469, partial [Bombardia bombarda]
MADLDTAGVLVQIPPPVKKRRRPALACEQCRLRKVRCDRNSPCSTCVRSGNPECTYQPTLLARLPIVGLRTRPASLDQNIRDFAATNDFSSGPFTGPTSAHTPSCRSSSSGATIETLERRVRQLEKELKSALGEGRSPSETDSRLSLASESERHSTLTYPPVDDTVPVDSGEIEKRNFVRLPIRGTISKTRFFGQSHWVNGASLLWSNVGFWAQQENTSELYDYFQKCKVLARVIKARRMPALPALSIGSNVPARPLADHLIDCYMRTFETVYRILHVPSFQAEYARYWEQPQATSQSFVVLMQLCMAIGACFHDDVHSLRAKATGWIYEAKFWLMLPPEKGRLTIPGLQIMCLLQLAKQTTGVNADLTWIECGSLLRAAMYMGLHHDPENLVRMPRLPAEMRRRLWAAILEICLQASLDAGGLPLVSLRDFETRPPANLDDRNMDADKGSSWTRMSAQIAIFSSFPTRLAIVSLVNDPQCGRASSASSYQETLRLGAELATETRALMNRLHSFPRDERGVDGVSPFQLRFAEMSMNRYLLALHLPWWHDAMRSPTFYFSRKTSVDAALTLAAIIRPPPELSSPSLTDFRRLLICGSGPFRGAPVHAGLTINLELLVRREEEGKNQGLTAAPLGSSAELFGVFDWYLDWWAARIRAGETNIKAYSFGQVQNSLLEAIDLKLGNEATMALIMEQATGRVKKAYEMLKAVAGD